MRCHEFKSRLHELLDARHVPEHDRALREHARLCDGCRQTLIAQRRLFELLRGTAPQPPEGPRLDHLVSLLEAETRRQRRIATARPPGWAGRLAVGGAVVAASLLLVVAATWLFVSSREANSGVLAKGPASPAPSPPHAAGHAPRRHLPAVAMARRLGKPVSPSHASSADAPHEEPQMAWHPAEWLLEAPRLPAHWQTYRPTVDELVVAIPQVAHRLDEVDQWAVGLRPLRVLLVRVWEAFWPATMLRRHDADPAVPQRQTGDAKGVDQRWWA